MATTNLSSSGNTWIKVSATSGTGSSPTITVTADNYTGRKARTTGKVTFKTTTGSPQQTKEVTVKQNGSFILTKTSGDNSEITASGTTVTIKGTSNTEKLSASVSGAGYSGGTLSITPSGGTKTTITSGSTIANDPGATASYTWEYTVTVGANGTVSARPATVTITATDTTPSSNTKSVTASLNQLAGAATLSVTPESIELNADGTPKTTGGNVITVTSNTSWSVS